MTIEEKRAMKAACVQAAATLIAARDSGQGSDRRGGVCHACRIDLCPGRYNRLAGACVARSRIPDSLAPKGDLTVPILPGLPVEADVTNR
jgi:hypothetical protein